MMTDTTIKPVGGLANSWRLAHTVRGFPSSIGGTIFGIAGVVWLGLTFLYAP
jgi:hypothetical protein